MSVHLFKACPSHTLQFITIFNLCITIIISPITANSKQQNEDDILLKSIQISGHIMLGGLFPMHEKGTVQDLCGDIKEDKGIQRVEAMLYAIDKINSDRKILPNISLGAHILDTCLRDTVGLEQSLEFIKTHLTTLDSTQYTCANGGELLFTQAKPVVGVIGAAASPVSIMVANILRLFKVKSMVYVFWGSFSVWRC